MTRFNPCLSKASPQNRQFAWSNVLVPLRSMSIGVGEFFGNSIAHSPLVPTAEVVYSVECARARFQFSSETLWYQHCRARPNASARG